MELMNRWLGYGNRGLGCGNQWLGCGMWWWSGTSCHETTPFPWSSSRAALPSPPWSNLAWTGFGFLQDLVPSPISPTWFASCCFCFRNQCNLAPRTNQIMGPPVGWRGSASSIEFSTVQVESPLITDGRKGRRFIAIISNFRERERERERDQISKML